MHSNGHEIRTQPKHSGSQVDTDRIEQIAHQLLEAIGEDPERPGLKDTPRRFANWWSEFIDYEPGKLNTTFESISTDQMVIVTGIKVWSLCEHHLLPFWCDLSIGYLTGDKVLGLSKFARIAHDVAHGLQIQERLVSQIAGRIEEATGSESVAVVGSGVHLCMVMRGAKTDAKMITSVMRGIFRDKPEARAEFLSLCNVD